MFIWLPPSIVSSARSRGATEVCTVRGPEQSAQIIVVVAFAHAAARWAQLAAWMMPSASVGAFASAAAATVVAVGALITVVALRRAPKGVEAKDGLRLLR